MSSETGWLDSLDELQREIELQEQTEKRRLLEKKASLQQDATREAELRRLALIEATTRMCKEALEGERTLDSRRLNTLLEVDPRWAQYRDTATKRAAQIQRLCQTERRNMERFSKLTDAHFNTKYNDGLHQQSPIHKKLLMEIDEFRKERIVPKEVEIGNYERRIRDLHQQNLALRSQLDYFTSQRQIQERNYQESQQKTKDECLELQRKLNGLCQERDMVLQELAKIDEKIHKATNDTTELKRQMKGSGSVHNLKLNSNEVRLFQ